MRNIVVLGDGEVFGVGMEVIIVSIFGYVFSFDSIDCCVIFF